MEKRYFGVHWLSTYHSKFVILWDDGTWESVEVPRDVEWGFNSRGKLNLRHCMHKKMTRTETMSWIEEQFNKMRES